MSAPRPGGDSQPVVGGQADAASTGGLRATGEPTVRPPVSARIQAPDGAVLARAVSLLRDGDLVGMPTETVYGLAADATQPEAVARIFAAKGRPNDHPVIVHVLPDADLAEWASRVPPAAKALAARFWPGPLTLILPRAAGVSNAVTGGQDTVGLRCPAHPVALALLRAFRDAGGSGAVAAPSANRFGRVSPTRATHVAEEFGTAVPLILDGGQCPIGIESTILDLSRERAVLLRPGHLSAAELAHAMGEAIWLPDGSLGHAPVDGQTLAAPEGVAPRVSGALAAHYAPRTRLQLVESEHMAAELSRLAAVGVRAAVWSIEPPKGVAPGAWRRMPADAEAMAHALYAVLRELDAGGFDQILVQAPPLAPAWEAVRDRLGRAVTGSGLADGV